MYPRRVGKIKSDYIDENIKLRIEAHQMRVTIRKLREELATFKKASPSVHVKQQLLPLFPKENAYSPNIAITVVIKDNP
jgi:hypothetical protein